MLILKWLYYCFIYNIIIVNYIILKSSKKFLKIFFCFAIFNIYYDMFNNLLKIFFFHFKVFNKTSYGIVIFCYR